MSIQTEIDRISQNLVNTYAVLEAMGCEMPSKQNSDNLATTAGTSKVVRYDAQSLTNEQKEQVRKNINSASIEEVGQLQEIVNEKANKTDISSPYNFKGSTTYSALPTSGNTVNDTYYCTDKKCKYTWNGNEWYQSSLNESDYEEELSVLGDVKEALYDNFTLGEWTNYRPNGATSGYQLFSKAHYLEGGTLVMVAETGYKVAYWMYSDEALQNQVTDSGYKQSITLENVPAGYYVLHMRRDDYEDIHFMESDKATFYHTDKLYNFKRVHNNVDLYNQERIMYYPRFLIPASCAVVMHRGANRLAPENSIPAFELAGQNSKVFGIETDVCATSDGHYVIMHDTTVDRTTNGTGRPRDMTLEEIRALTIDTGANISNYPNLQVPTLEEYLLVCKKYGKVAFIEIKHEEDNPPTFMEDIYKIIKKCGMEMSCMIMSFELSYLDELRKVSRHIPFAFVCQWSLNVNSNHGRMVGFNNCVNISEANAKFTKELVEQLHNLECFVGVWSPYQSDFNKWADMGVDLFTTDELPTE